MISPPAAIGSIPSGRGGAARSWSRIDSSVRPLTELERMAIVHALQVCDGNKTRAAQQLGISRQTLRTKLKDMVAGKAKAALEKETKTKWDEKPVSMTRLYA